MVGSNYCVRTGLAASFPFGRMVLDFPGLIDGPCRCLCFLAFHINVPHKLLAPLQDHCGLLMSTAFAYPALSGAVRSTGVG